MGRPIFDPAGGAWYDPLMFGFLLKKTFFDMWDNLFRVIILNAGFLACFALVFLLPGISAGLPALAYVVFFLGIAVLAVYTGAASRMMSEIADYRHPGFSDFLSFVKQSYASSLILALFLVAYVFTVRFAFSFYGGLSSLLGPLAVALLFWITVALILAGQFFFPVQSRLDGKFRKISRKSFILFIDNPWFSVGLIMAALVTSIISAFTAFLVPGFATLLLFWNVALKLRLYKYDYLEQNPKESRKRIPWDALLVEDRERLGKRTLKGMIFPWKE
jgi:hypothetical protein